jgi:DNA-binding GntR family transcriptional regulator
MKKVSETGGVVPLPGKVIGAKIRKNTMRSQIKKYIQDQIKNGVYKPGARIPETGLAKELNVSQAPVREAILELSVMGLLEERPYSGTYVRVLTAEDIEDIYNIRAFIEEFAARRAAKRMTDEDLQAFLPVLKQMEQAVKNKDVEEFNVADIKFHELILVGAQSKALKRTWETLQMGEWTSFTLQATKRSLHELLEDHKNIYQHLVNRSDYSAGASMFLHIKNFTNDLVAYIVSKEEKDNQA